MWWSLVPKSSRGGSGTPCSRSRLDWARPLSVRQKWRNGDHGSSEGSRSQWGGRLVPQSWFWEEEGRIIGRAFFFFSSSLFSPSLISQRGAAAAAAAVGTDCTRKKKTL